MRGAGEEAAEKMLAPAEGFGREGNEGGIKC